MRTIEPIIQLVVHVCSCDRLKQEMKQNCNNITVMFVVLNENNNRNILYHITENQKNGR